MMLPIPSYWLPQPPLNLDSATRAAIEQLFVAAVAPGTGETIAYELTAPKWQFLIRGHDDERLAARATANPAGFPWGDDDET